MPIWQLGQPGDMLVPMQNIAQYGIPHSEYRIGLTRRPTGTFENWQITADVALDAGVKVVPAVNTLCVSGVSPGQPGPGSGIFGNWWSLEIWEDRARLLQEQIDYIGPSNVDSVMLDFEGTVSATFDTFPDGSSALTFDKNPDGSTGPGGQSIGDPPFIEDIYYAMETAMEPLGAVIRQYELDVFAYPGRYYRSPLETSSQGNTYMPNMIIQDLGRVTNMMEGPDYEMWDKLLRFSPEEITETSFTLTTAIDAVGGSFPSDAVSPQTFSSSPGDYDRSGVVTDATVYNINSYTHAMERAFERGYRILLAAPAHTFFPDFAQPFRDHFDWTKCDAYVWSRRKPNTTPSNANDYTPSYYEEAFLSNSGNAPSGDDFNEGASQNIPMGGYRTGPHTPDEQYAGMKEHLDTLKTYMELKPEYAIPEILVKAKFKSLPETSGGASWDNPRTFGDSKGDFGPSGQGQDLSRIRTAVKRMGS